ncbi:MAG: hypothetical protein HY763_07045 [Planctomycetes bacterium]|nr:hypothetical protein [Planctomycetota bacterium]
MTAGTPERPEHSLEAYLDGLLADSERAEFDRRVRSDPALRAEAECQARIDEALKRLYTPSAAGAPALASLRAASTNGRAATTLRSPLSAARRARPAPALRRGLAVAAAVAFCSLAGWQVWCFVRPAAVVDAYAAQAWRSMDTVYRDEVSSGLKPSWVCKDNEEFARSFEKRFGQPLYLAPPPSGVTVAGLSYCNTITRRTMHLLARVNGSPVMVFADSVPDDTRPSLPPGQGLRLFRREIGKVVLYEVTPLSEPRVLDLFYDPATRPAHDTTWQSGPTP